MKGLPPSLALGAGSAGPLAGEGQFQKLFFEHMGPHTYIHTHTHARVHTPYKQVKMMFSILEETERWLRA